VVHTAKRVASYDELRARLDSPDYQPRTEALVLAAPPTLAPCNATETATVLPGNLPNRVRIDATLGCRGLLILSDIFYPGWTATIDGRTVAIIETYGALRGVVLETGSHQIEFTYQPSSALAGFTLTVLGIAFVCWTYHRAKKPSAA